jgi:hypothetical protein
METKYPKKIKQIMREAPMAYSILALMDYKNGSVEANELFIKWQRDKKIIATNDSGDAVRRLAEIIVLHSVILSIFFH